ncbi:MAG: hypothetical protein E6371_02835 [Terrisporobacter othiniensis]|uniref:hypothetical protein n=1 Tax=Terrisporobacter othiniensis TaxID=1577792 RepID=UPI0029104020|nr:hypothetical protein [Terrisporobacter othiniensis]MDU6983329.1 hypothetical protein [Terrisporobacter othiniensis]
MEKEKKLILLFSIIVIIFGTSIYFIGDRKKTLKENSTEISGMKAYFELSREYLNESQFTKSEEAFKDLKELGINEGKKEDIVKYSLLRAHDISFYAEGKNKAVEILEDALELAKEINYDNIEDVYFELGRAYW